MGKHMQQTGITLQIYPQVERSIDDPLQVINTFFEIAIPEIQGGNFIVENQDAVLVNKQRVFFQLFLNVRH
jgi:hypothetical protein